MQHIILKVSAAVSKTEAIPISKHADNTHYHWPGQYSMQAVLYREEVPHTAEATATTANDCLHCLQNSFCKGVTCFFCPHKSQSSITLLDNYWSREDR